MSFTETCLFTGYDHLEDDGKIIALFKDGHRVDELSDEGQVILNQTPFYVQSGGQVADTGEMVSDTVKARVLDGIKTRNGQHLLKVKVEEGILHQGDEVHQIVDGSRRADTTANHSATHLLQSALKSVLGDDIHQAGSYVGPEYLRFDFNYSDKLTPEQLSDIENRVNVMIESALPVTKEVMDIEEAKKTGATALFDEKYGDKVRVVTMGDVSKEFCAGCHVGNTDEIGLLKITGEESIGSDTRRITAKSRKAAYDEFASERKMLENIAKSAKAKGIKNLDVKVENSFEQMKEMQKEIAELKNQIFALKAREWANQAEEINGLNVLVRQVSDMDGKALKDIAAMLKGNDPKMAVLLISDNNGRLALVAGAGSEAVKKGVHAGNLVKAAAMTTGGKGGGKPDFAQAGGTDASAIAKASEDFKAAVAAL